MPIFLHTYIYEKNFYLFCAHDINLFPTRQAKTALSVCKQFNYAKNSLEYLLKLFVIFINVSGLSF
jgi:hypothetical protein